MSFLFLKCHIIKKTYFHKKVNLLSSVMCCLSLDVGKAAFLSEIPHSLMVNLDFPMLSDEQSCKLSTVPNKRNVFLISHMSSIANLDPLN